MADELDPRARALLAAYRRDAGPSPAATERLLASVRRSATAAEEARVVPLRPRRVSRQWLGVAVVGLVAAALALAFKLSPRRLDADVDAARSAAAHQAAEGASDGSVTPRAPRGAGEPATSTDGAPAPETEVPALQRPTATTHESEAPAARASEAPGGTSRGDGSRGPSGSGVANGGRPTTGANAGTAGGAPANGETHTNVGTAGPTNSGASGSAGDANAGTAASDRGDGLAQELAIVRAVNDALAGGSEALALARLDDYHRRFPDGALREEAAALRAVALCAAGRADGATTAAAFLRAHPGSLSAERVRRACGVR
ncbi:hypothetical protein [Nannocystis punicea]|uniref:Uncharacterized protein n=1 Tax=Nannocystis punicea TaxID=2995304 RepID=A0ABY7GUV5_9BACT|nr:hypothetical protein [Nannocystis poenicansa]WAS90609.1 hypothetical protein O0S08_30855 [Nannocystis poenicansa]